MKPMKDYAEYNMPSALETINGEKGLQKFLSKAETYGLPKAIAFAKGSSSTSTLKALSIEHRRKMLIGLVKGTKNNQAVMQKYGVEDLPTVLVLPVESEAEPILYKKKPSFNGLNFFFAKHALSEPVYGKPQEKEEQKEEKSKTEL